VVKQNTQAIIARAHAEEHKAIERLRNLRPHLVDTAYKSPKESVTVPGIVQYIVSANQSKPIQDQIPPHLLQEPRR